MKTPGQIAYQAYCATTDWKSLVSGADLPKWEEVKPEIKQAWENAALAVRMPLARKVYQARRALARLLVTYRNELLGNWYEASAEASGMALDEIGFIKGPYAHEDADQMRGPSEVAKIAADTSE